MPQTYSVQFSTDCASSLKLPFLKRWKDLTPEERHREIIRCAAKHGGQAVTLNLAPAFADYLVTTTNPMRQIGKRMNSELNAAELAAFRILLVLEATRADGRPHLHGVFIANDVSRLKVQHVMRRAVGFIAGRSGSRQFMAKNIYAPDGCASYIYKDARATRRFLDLSQHEPLTWVARPMTQFAHDSYEAVRLGLTHAANVNGPMLCVS